jgi:hypothetical protein
LLLDNNVFATIFKYKIHACMFSRVSKPWKHKKPWKNIPWSYLNWTTKIRPGNEFSLNCKFRPNRSQNKLNILWIWTA